MKLVGGESNPGSKPDRRHAWLVVRFGLARILGHPSRALALLRQLRDKFQEHDLCDAFSGRLLLEAGQPVEARLAYQDVFRRSRDRPDRNGEFLRWLAEGWINIIDGAPLKADQCFARAGQMDVRRLLQRANPGPALDRPHPLDEEFERWMQKHHPNE